jgi:hypothetical protein
MAEQQEFKFPDESETNASQNGVNIEIVDDTPPEDKDPSTGKVRDPMPKELVEELENDPLDDYSEKVKHKLRQMKKVWHDERREKERLAREKMEAERFAQIQFEENRKLKQRLGYGEKAYIQEVTKSANNELVTAKERLKQAYEAGDAEKITEAQETLTEAKLKLREYERYRPSLQIEEQGVQQNQQVTTPQVSAPAVDPKAEAWRQKNTWFGADEEMTALALGLHEKLVRSGVDPRSDDYYRRVDETMKKRFPEAFDDATEEEQTKEQAKTAPRTSKPAANVVAPVTRATAPRQVRLTTSQVAIAKKLGLSNEQYAQELMKLENYNG